MNQQKLDIYRAQATDIEEIKVLALQNNMQRNENYWMQTLSRLETRELDVLVARMEGSGAGYGFLNWQPKYRAYEVQNIPEIQDLNVLPQFRRQGVARAMIEVCENLARQKGCSQIGISFGLTREFGPAQILYTSMGYLPDGFGVTYDREPVQSGQMRPVDDDLCLMLIKKL
jgi:GNAT superfamily N-acetyltransferase